MRVFIAFIFLLVSGCSNKGEDVKSFTPSIEKKESLELKHIRSFHIKNPPDTAILAKIFPKFKINNDKRIALKDFLFEHIIIVDSLGNILDVIGKKGKGPGEFVEITNWNFDENDNLIVFDQSQGLLKVFNRNGELIQSSVIFGNKNFVGFGRSLFAHDSLIYIGIIQSEYMNLTNAAHSKLIAISNYNGKLQKVFGKYDPYVSKATMYTVQPMFDIDFQQDRMYSTHMNSYRVQVYNLKNYRRMAYFGFRSKHFKESEEEISPFAPKYKRREMALNQSFTKDIYVTSKYIILCFYNLTGEWYQSRSPKAKEYYISVYNRNNFSFIDEISLPYGLNAVNNNRLYLVENSNPDNYTIGLYEIQVNR